MTEQITQAMLQACEFRYVHASGPGGQHVNKTATAVELRVHLNKLDLPPAVHRRLREQQRNRINRDAQLIIQADEFRSQKRNKDAALERLADMLAKARIAPKRRIATKPSQAARRARINNKKQRGEVKSMRRKPRLDS